MTRVHFVPSESKESWRRVAEAVSALAEPITVGKLRNLRGAAARAGCMLAQEGG
jgi:hypothetical protein